jgi:uncharacterized protein (UPF0261 family)
MPTIAVLGTFDTKGEEHAFVAEIIRSQGHDALLIDVGTGGSPIITPDISQEEVAQAGGIDLTGLRQRRDRGECVAAMAAAAPILLEKLHRDGRFDAIISLGGGGGTAIASAAMRALPIGVPKVLVSTLAAGNTAPYLGTKDIALMPAIVDIAGLNRISRTILSRAAGAICGMVSVPIHIEEDRRLIAASMFGNTTDCVNIAKSILESAGYEVLVFHATGTGGKTMEALIDSGLVAAVLDVTTTELADELVGGILSAGPDRLNAAARAGIPAVIAPGCLDMVNFGEKATVPVKFAGRTFYEHNPHVTLMRTSPDECAQLGRMLAEKANAYRGPATVLIPRRGVSVISTEGGPFFDHAADAALFDAITRHLRPEIPVVSLDRAINDPKFATACAEALLKSLKTLCVSPLDKR